MYGHVLPDLAKHVRSESDMVTGDHEAEVLPIPKCFFARFETGGSSKDDMIIMENLEAQGFAFHTNVEKFLSPHAVKEFINFFFANK